MYAGVVQNFMNFNAVGIIIIAMVGVGVAEEAGLVKALIRRLVIIATSKLLTYILIFVGVFSSIAADAGYLVLIRLAGLILLLVLVLVLILVLVIRQFIAFFNDINMATLAAVSMATFLQALNLPTIAVLIGFVIAVFGIDLLNTAAIAKWAIFAPAFIPLLLQLGVEPEVVLAAYRVGDSPMNSITPLDPYFAMIVTFAIKYQKVAGVGTVIARIGVPTMLWSFLMATLIAPLLYRP